MIRLVCEVWAVILISGAAYAWWPLSGVVVVTLTGALGALVGIVSLFLRCGQDGDAAVRPASSRGV